PEQSLFYIQATHRHATGASAIVSAMQGQTILAWIKQAQANAGSMPGTPPPSPTCPSAQSFNAPVFQAEIQPILFAKIDPTNPGNPAVTTGSPPPTWHGAHRPDR